MVETTVTVSHSAGLHLRPAAIFVQTAARFGSEVRIQNLSRPDTPEVNGKSMFGIMQSGVSEGHLICLRVEGPDEETALKTLRDLIDRDFEQP